MSFSLQDNYIIINDTYDKLLFESLFFETNEVYEHITIKEYISTYREKESKKDRVLFLDTVKKIIYDIYRQISYLELHNLSFSHEHAYDQVEDKDHKHSVPDEDISKSFYSN